jgi:hypothetical protein
MRTQRCYFHEKRAKTDKGILQLLNMVEKSRIWKGHVTVMCALQQSKFEVKNPYPYPLKPAPVSAGTGFRGYGYGLPWNTPGLPVLFPNCAMPALTGLWFRLASVAIDNSHTSHA